jgi:hypothetical protein
MVVGCTDSRLHLFVLHVRLSTIDEILSTSCCIGRLSGTSFHKVDTSLAELIPQEQLLFLLCVSFVPK